MSPLSKALIMGLLTCLLGSVAAITPNGPSLEERIGLDLLFQLRGSRTAPPDVVIVSMDNSSMNILGLPKEVEKWPRSLHARLIEKLIEKGAALIVFDVHFKEAHSREDDILLADAMRKAHNVILCESLRSEVLALSVGEGAPGGKVSIEAVVPPIPLLARSAVASAPFPLPRVPVKVSQFWMFRATAGDKPTLPVVAFQTLALDVLDELARLMEKTDPSEATKLPLHKDAVMEAKGVEGLIRTLREIFHAKPWLAEKLSRELDHPEALSLDAGRTGLLRSIIRMYQGNDARFLNFHGPPGTVRTLPYHEVLRDRGQPAGLSEQLDLSNKVVFVGLSEYQRLEQKDGFYTVFSQPSGLDISGVEIAATSFANLLEDVSVQPLGFRELLAAVMVWGMVLGMSCRLLPAGISVVTATGLSFLLLVVAVHQFSKSGIWYPLVVPLLIQAPFACFGSVLWRNFDINRERRNIRHAFEYYLPAKVIDQLARDFVNLKSSNQIVYGSCLCTDVEQYTSVSEKLDPGDLGDLMNQYFGAIFKPVKKHGGMISEVAGDSMLALWATSRPDAGLRKEACLAALDIAGAVHRFNLSMNPLQLPTRIGLHSGRMFLGNIGAIDHYEYQAAGDIVNTASRIEGLNKHLGTRTLVSREVLEELDGFLTRELGSFVLIGKSKPIVVHELICRIEDSSEEQRNLCSIFGRALDLARQHRWEEAIETFDGLISAHGDDGPSRFFLELCHEYRDNPHKEPWPGSMTISSK